MKLIILCVFLIYSAQFSFATYYPFAGNQIDVKYKYLNGSQAPNQHTVYTNAIYPGARVYPTAFANSDDLYCFGGHGFVASGGASGTNDLFKNTQTSDDFSTWSFVSGSKALSNAGAYSVKGSYSASIYPSGRQRAIAWKTTASTWILYGGYGVDGAASSSQELNDMWEFNPTTSQWKWVGGSSTGNVSPVRGTKGTYAAANTPGGRSSSIVWSNGGDVTYLFGGGTIDTGDFYTDLMAFKYSTGEWKWTAGSNTAGIAASYGPVGNYSSTNLPGSRLGAASWATGSGSSLVYWMFGGEGMASTTSSGFCADLWSYNPTTNQFAYRGGSKTMNSQGTYDNVKMFSATAWPGSRSDLTTFQYNSLVWMFGGEGYAGTTSQGKLNDLWAFNPDTLQWSWVHGSSDANQVGAYGSTYSASYYPGARSGYALWQRSSMPDRVYIFGGNGQGASTSGRLNDFWALKLPPIVTPTPTTAVTPTPGSTSGSARASTVSFTAIVLVFAGFVASLFV